MNTAKTSQRAECLKYARVNGLQAKGDKAGIVTVFSPKTNWVDCFEGWQEVYAFFQTANEARIDHLAPFPWERKQTARPTA